MIVLNKYRKCSNSPLPLQENFCKFAPMTTLYVSDMDGTLLAPDSRVSTETARIISDLTAQGALITVATARTPATVEPLLSATATSLPAVVMTGAALWNRRKQRYEHAQTMHPYACEAIELLFRKYGVTPFVYTLGSDSMMRVYYHGNMSEKERKFVAEREHAALKRFYINEATTVEGSVALYFAMGECRRIFALADALRSTGACSVSAYIDIFGPDTGILEVFAPGVSKAAAIKRLKKAVGADRLVVFGDNLNDLPMMEIADVAVAVENALPEVRSAADEVIGPNSTDSVARFIAADYVCCTTNVGRNSIPKA